MQGSKVLVCLYMVIIKHGVLLWNVNGEVNIPYMDKHLRGNLWFVAQPRNVFSLLAVGIIIKEACTQ